MNKKPIVFGYCRVSTTKQTYENQKLAILEYANKQGWKVAHFIKTQVSSRKGKAERGIDELERAAREGKLNIIVFTELSRLGRSVGQIIRSIDTFVDTYEVELHFIKEGMVLRAGERDINSQITLTLFSLLAEIESYLIRERTCEALNARRKAGVKLGRPKLKSKLDNKEDEIKGLIELGVKQKAIAKKMECTEATLSNWLKRKKKEWSIN